MVYYRAETTGWGATFAGQPTRLWVPRILTDDATFGAQNGKFGFTITSPSGLNLVVEASEAVVNAAWVTVGTLTAVNGSSIFIDPDAMNHAARFYRLRLP